MKLASAALAILWAGAAQAQEFAPHLAGRSAEQHISSPAGLSLQAGGGVTAFAAKDARNVTDVGGSWEARFVLGTRQVVGAEAAYVGTARGINTLGMSSNAALVSHGLEAVLRLSAPFILSDVLVEPLAFAGVGWARYGLVNEGTNTSIFAGHDNIATLPFGAGLAMGYRGFIADARFTYRGAVDDTTLINRTTGGDRASLQSWNAGLQLGYEF